MQHRHQVDHVEILVVMIENATVNNLLEEKRNIRKPWYSVDMDSFSCNIIISNVIEQYVHVVAIVD
jgi:hypothetical protein